MSAFDRNNGHLVVRVVYDGPEAAGKTENLEQLVRTFTSQRRSELSSPRKDGERTAYFDWLYLNGGVVGGHALRAQLVTTPGRCALTRRRWQLVRSADVIVFVCESTTRGLKEARRSLELLRIDLEASDLRPPVIVQANKQDLPGAIPPEEVARALGLASDAEVVSASASTGHGVRETVVRAIRAAASLAEGQILARGVDGLPDAEDEAQLLEQLDGSSQMRAALAVEGEPPPFPDEGVEGEWVWPSASGRKVLRALSRSLIADGVTRLSAEAGSTRLRVGGLSIGTTPERRLDSPSAARSALVELARRHVRLGVLSAPRTTLALVRGRDDAIWLWTISPWTMTLRERLEAAESGGDRGALASALRLYARGIAEALLLAARDEVEVDLDPASFGEVDGTVVYVGDRVSAAASLPSIVSIIPEVPRRWARHAEEAREYVTALGAAIGDEWPLSGDLRASIARAFQAIGHGPAPTEARGTHGAS